MHLTHETLRVALCGFALLPVLGCALPSDATTASPGAAETTATSSASTAAPKGASTDAAPAPTAPATPAQAAPAAAAAPAAKPETPPAKPPTPVASASAPARSSASGDVVSFGEPLFVNGQRISELELKRYLIYTVGRNLIAYHKLGVIIGEELRQRAWTGAVDEAEQARQQDPSMSEAAVAARRDQLYAERLKTLQQELAVSDETFQAEHDRRVKDFQVKYPVLDTEAEIARAYGSPYEFTRHLRQQMNFDAVFLPINPADWPAVTVEAFLADPGGGELLLDDAKQSYEMRMQVMEERELDRLPPDDDLLLNIHRQIVRDALFRLVEFRSGSQLPEDRVLWADADGDGQPELELGTEDLWPEVQPMVVERDVRNAKRFAALMAASRERMAADGILLDDAACRAVMDEYASSFEELTFTMDVAIVQTNGFPAVEIFEPYYCMLEGYKRAHLSELIDADGKATKQLAEHLPIAQMITGLGQVDTEVLLVSAIDIGKNAWKPNGWASAKSEAEALIEQIEKHREEYAGAKQEQKLAQAMGKPAPPLVSVPEPAVFWSQLLDDHSDWWDPPPPAAGPGKQADLIYKKNGRFGPRHRGDLLGFMGETPFDDFLNGGTITDEVFFEQEENTVSGPHCGPLGFYIVKLLRRVQPSRALSASDPSHVERLLEDYLRVAFRDYCQEALRDADVKGMPERCSG